MSEDNDGIKSGLGCVVGVVAILFVVALGVGVITGKTEKTLSIAKDGSSTIIGAVVIGFVLIGFMMFTSKKR